MRRLLAMVIWGGTASLLLLLAIICWREILVFVTLMVGIVLPMWAHDVLFREE